MNFYQSLNASTTTAIIAAAAISVFNYFTKMAAGFYYNAFCIIMALFFLLFAIKSGLEDHRYFIHGHAPQGEQFFGIIVTAFTRLLFAIGAYTLPQPEISLRITSVAFVSLSVWVSVHIVRISYFKIETEFDRNTTERKYWLYWNVLYAVPGFISFFVASVSKIDFLAILILCLVLYDIVTSKTYRLQAGNS